MVILREYKSGLHSGNNTSLQNENTANNDKIDSNSIKAKLKNIITKFELQSVSSSEFEYIVDDISSSNTNSNYDELWNIQQQYKRNKGK